MLRLGVLGAGGHSTRNHGPALARYRDQHPDEIELAAVCDLDARARDRYAERFDFEAAYASAAGMLAAEQLDALVAVTPVDATREVAGSLLEQGIPLLLEKPPGRTVQEATELARIAATYETPHAVSMNRRFNPAFRRVRDCFESRVGSPPSVAIGRLHRTNRTEADFVKDTGIHAIDAVCAVVGPPRRVETAAWPGGWETGHGHFCLGRTHHDDAIASVELLSDVGTSVETYAFYAPGVSATVDARRAACTVTIEGDTVLDWGIEEDLPTFVRNGTYDETVAFLEAVAGDRPFWPTLGDVVPSLAAAEAMNDGRSERIDLDLP